MSKFKMGKKIQKKNKIDWKSNRHSTLQAKCMESFLDVFHKSKQIRIIEERSDPWIFYATQNKFIIVNVWVEFPKQTEANLELIPLTLRNHYFHFSITAVRNALLAEFKNIIPEDNNFDEFNESIFSKENEQFLLSKYSTSHFFKFTSVYKVCDICESSHSRSSTMITIYDKNFNFLRNLASFEPFSHKCDIRERLLLFPTLKLYL
jgi:hypothetical protein